MVTKTYPKNVKLMDENLGGKIKRTQINNGLKNIEYGLEF